MTKFIHLSDDDIEVVLKDLMAEKNRRREEKMWPIQTKLYLHGCKDTNWGTAEELKLPTDEAKKTFSYCGYEVEFTLLVQKDGNAVATHVGGIKLESPLEMT